MIDSGNHAAVMDSISKAGMSAFAGRILTELSDGERQRAMIAMVLAQDADLMIMDEPTAFLDIRSRFEIFNLLRDLTRKRGKTIVFSTHDFDAAVSRADKIWLMLGDGLEEGAPEDLILSGNAGRLFDETEFLFNPHNGTFMTAGEKKGAISVTGAGDKRYWTEKAVIRSGYTISDNDFYARLFVPDENNSLWRLDDGNHSNSFDNLYSLSSWLRNNPPSFP
jgi:iron complex transport system ATP-binding protein